MSSNLGNKIVTALNRNKEINKTAKELNIEFYKEQELKQIAHDLNNPIRTIEENHSLALQGMFLMGGLLGLVVGLILGSIQ